MKLSNDNTIWSQGRGRLSPVAILLIVVSVAIPVGIIVALVVLGAFTSGRTGVGAGGKAQLHKSFERPPNVRVLLASGIRNPVSYPIRVAGAYFLIDPTNKKPLLKGKRLSGTPVYRFSSGLMIRVPGVGGSTKNLRLQRLRIVPAKDGTLYLGGKPYRGMLDLIYRRGGRMMAVNELSLEEYVGGSVAAEVPHDWPAEALRAQAVAIRTYTLAIIMEKDKQVPRPEVDVTNSYLVSQEYKGMKEERPSTIAAARATRGEVLVFDRKVFRAYYSSSCGGHTEACGEVWDDYKTIPPLAGTVCNYCQGSRDHQKGKPWQVTLGLAYVTGKVSKGAHNVGTVRSLSFSDINRNGHMDRVRVNGHRGSVVMKGNDFRMAVGTRKLKSMRFTSKAIRSGYVFTGYGWGHGVGMCQWGAKKMADRLYRHPAILKYYYPNTELWKVY